jgi:acetone carboxylase, gamma subunit
MKIKMTEALSIDLDREVWRCNKCDCELGCAHQSYKHGLIVQARDPREIHQSIIDPQKYEQTFAPEPEWVRVVEYYCPHCALLAETEYLPPGHPPVMDMEFDLNSLRATAEQQKLTEA